MIKERPAATLAVMFLVTLLLISLFGRFFITDNTPDANRQITELPLVKAGYHCDIVVISNKNGNDQWIPIRDHHKRNSAIEIERIINLGGETVSQSIPIEKVVEVRHQTFWLGTDELGRDILSRLLVGIKISLFIGFFSVLVSCIVGVKIGLLAGYFGGWVDMFLTIMINSLWSIPTILLVFALVLAIGRGVENIILAIGLTMWIDIARLIRGLTKTVREKDYILATRALSFPRVRIILNHIFPNMIDPLIVLATANFATAILVEAGISYLGFGIQPPSPSVGILLSENYAYILGGHYLKALAPAVVIVLMVLSLNLIGTALRDTLSVEMKGKPA